MKNIFESVSAPGVTLKIMPIQGQGIGFTIRHQDEVLAGATISHSEANQLCAAVRETGSQSSAQFEATSFVFSTELPSRVPSFGGTVSQAQVDVFHRVVQERGLKPGTPVCEADSEDDLAAHDIGVVLGYTQNYRVVYDDGSGQHVADVDRLWSLGRDHYATLLISKTHEEAQRKDEAVAARVRELTEQHKGATTADTIRALCMVIVEHEGLLG